MSSETGFPSLLDLLVVIDAHIDQLTNQFRIKSDELKAKAKQVRHKGIEVLNKRTKGFRHALTEREKLDKTQDTVEKEIQKIRKNVGRRVNVFLEKWDDAKAVSMREKVRYGLANMVLTPSRLVADCFLSASLQVS
jgi:biotin operon repressor